MTQRKMAQKKKKKQAPEMAIDLNTEEEPGSKIIDIETSSTEAEMGKQAGPDQSRDRARGDAKTQEKHNPNNCHTQMGSRK